MEEKTSWTSRKRHEAMHSERQNRRTRFRQKFSELKMHVHITLHLNELYSNPSRTFPGLDNAICTHIRLVCKSPIRLEQHILLAWSLHGFYITILNDIWAHIMQGWQSLSMIYWIESQSLYWARITTAFSRCLYAYNLHRNPLG
jgi:hypothetical protein